MWEGSHALPPPLLNGAMSCAYVLCLRPRLLPSLLRGQKQGPAPWRPQGAGSSSLCGGHVGHGSVPRCRQVLSLPPRQAQAGSAAVWSLEGR